MTFWVTIPKKKGENEYDGRLHTLEIQWDPKAKTIVIKNIFGSKS